MRVQSNEGQLKFLFSRLTWPSPLVRERTCVNIANLLLDPATSSRITQYLMLWLSEQTLESVAANGLLILVRAKNQDPSFILPPIADILVNFKKKSLLSLQILEDLYPGQSGSINDSLLYSEQVPQDFMPNSFFFKYIERFLPAIYNYWAKIFEERGVIFFREQWSYEWQLLVDYLGIKLSSRPLDFWNSNSTKKEFTPSLDTIISEIYRSSFLRTLARSVAKKFVPQHFALEIAAETAPLDLELWKIQPNQKPNWWPSVDVSTNSTGQLDITLGEIWRQVQELWDNNQTKISTDQVLLNADGIVYDRSTVYNLEIFGLFQKCLGPSIPNFEEIGNWVKEENWIKVKQSSNLRLKGYFNNPRRLI